MSKLNVSFYLKKDKQRNGESAIYAKIKLGSTTSTMSTGKYLNSVRWGKTNMLLNAKRKGDEVSLKNYIYEIPRKISDIYLELSKETKNISARDLKNAFSGKINNGSKITIIQLLFSQLLGHSSISITEDSYEKIVKKKVSQEIMRLNRKIK